MPSHKRSGAVAAMVGLVALAALPPAAGAYVPDPYDTRWGVTTEIWCDPVAHVMTLHTSSGQIEGAGGDVVMRRLWGAIRAEDGSWGPWQIWHVDLPDGPGAGWEGVGAGVSTHLEPYEPLTLMLWAEYAFQPVLYEDTRFGNEWVTTYELDPAGQQWVAQPLVGGAGAVCVL